MSLSTVSGFGQEIESPRLLASALRVSADKTAHLVLPPVAMMAFFAGIGRMLAPSALPFGIYYATHNTGGQFVSNWR